MSERYSLRDPVLDGCIVAPRWVHHFVVKAFVQHTVPWVVLVVLLPWQRHTWWVPLAVITGPVFWFVLAIKEYVHPSDPVVYTLAEHADDWFTDFALSLTPLIIALMLHTWVPGLLVLGAAASLYIGFHRGARP